jgi:hypothetical protein
MWIFFVFLATSLSVISFGAEQNTIDFSLNVEGRKFEQRGLTLEPGRAMSFLAREKREDANSYSIEVLLEKNSTNEVSLAVAVARHEAGGRTTLTDARLTGVLGQKLEAKGKALALVITPH